MMQRLIHFWYLQHFYITWLSYRIELRPWKIHNIPHVTPLTIKQEVKCILFIYFTKINARRFSCFLSVSFLAWEKNIKTVELSIKQFNLDVTSLELCHWIWNSLRCFHCLPLQSSQRKYWEEKKVTEIPKALKVPDHSVIYFV